MQCEYCEYVSNFINYVKYTCRILLEFPDYKDYIWTHILKCPFDNEDSCRADKKIIFRITPYIKMQKIIYCCRIRLHEYSTTFQLLSVRIVHIFMKYSDFFF